MLGVEGLRLGAGDWFLDLFTGEAERLLEQGPWGRGGRVEELVEPYWWVPGLPEASVEPPTVAAVDGGGALVPLQGGGALYIARAYGYVEGGEPERVLELRYYPVRETVVLDALRSWLEHRAATRLVLRLPPGSVLLMDGSLWVTVTVSLSALARLARGAVQGPGGVYAGVLSAYTLAEVAQLAEAAGRRGVLVAYVSKDHGFRALKEKLLLDRVAGLEPRLGPLVEAALEWYPLPPRARIRLLESRGLLQGAALRLLDAALDPSYRDPSFIDEVAGQGQGYSWLLRLPPPQRVHRVLARLGARGLVEAAAERAEQLLPPGEREAHELRDQAGRVAAAVDQLPAPLLQYMRPAPGDPLLLVEHPGPVGGYHSPGRVLQEPRGSVLEALAAIVSGYAGPEYYNIPLIAAHLNATLSSRQLGNYLRLLESLAAARGVSLGLARRASMARRLARRRRRRL